MIHELIKLFKKIKAKAYKVDILVNNAGIVTGKKFLESSDAAIERTMNVNVNAHFWVISAAFNLTLAATLT